MIKCIWTYQIYFCVCCIETDQGVRFCLSFSYDNSSPLSFCNVFVVISSRQNENLNHFLCKLRGNTEIPLYIFFYDFLTQSSLCTVFLASVILLAQEVINFFCATFQCIPVGMESVSGSLHIPVKITDELLLKINVEFAHFFRSFPLNHTGNRIPFPCYRMSPHGIRLEI